MKWKFGAFAVVLVFAIGGVQVAGLNESVATPVVADNDAFDAYKGQVGEEPPASDPAQEDAGIPGDAPGMCENVDSRRQVDDIGDDIHAMLVEFDDHEDAFVASTDDSNGKRVNLRVLPDLPENVQRLNVDVFPADCGESVLDEDASYYDRVGPTTGEAQQVVEADLSSNHCKSNDNWDLKLTGLGLADKPAAIFIEWTNGETEWVSQKAASTHYVTAANLGYTIRSAEAVVPDDWSGRFYIHKQPCGQVDGGADPVERQVPGPYTSEDGLYVEWEARAESYIVVVTLEEGIAPATSTAGAATGAVGISDELSMQTCHRECMGALLYSVDLGVMT